MKTTHLPAIAVLAFSFYSYGQENEIPVNGNVGIGTTSPTSKLDVRGDVKIDSVLNVGDSLVVARGATISEDLKVTEDTYLNGSLKLKSLKNETTTDAGLLLIDPEGNVTRGGALLAEVYADISRECKDGNGGFTTPANPTWANRPGAIYATQQCVPDVKVGIGTTEPAAKLHILLNDEAPGIQTHALVVERTNGTKILQLTEEGLLQAREIKVDLMSWPDYVFENEYPLPPLDELAAYIEHYGHLPNVRSACDMEREGMNVSETSVLLMEKIEELTLYLIDLQEQLQAQREEIDTLKTNGTQR